MFITVKTLRAFRACIPQRVVFDRIFPEGAELTIPNARRAAEAKLDMDWAADVLLSPAAHDHYHELLVGPRQVFDAALAEESRALEAATREARGAFDEAVKAPEHDYLEAVNAAQRAYGAGESEEATTAEAQRAYDDAVDEACRVYYAAAEEANRAYHVAMDAARSLVVKSGPRETFALAKAEALIIAGNAHGWRTV